MNKTCFSELEYPLFVNGSLHYRLIDAVDASTLEWVLNTLKNITRYSGQIHGATVLKHSVSVASHIDDKSSMLYWQFLSHDFCEAFVGDSTKNFKTRCQASIEEELGYHIREHFGIKSSMSKDDLQLLSEIDAESTIPEIMLSNLNRASKSHILKHHFNVSDEAEALANLRVVYPASVGYLAVPGLLRDAEMFGLRNIYETEDE